jgi:hypothetical protein
MGPAEGKKGLEIKAAITMPPILQLISYQLRAKLVVRIQVYAFVFIGANSFTDLF